MTEWKFWIEVFSMVGEWGIVAAILYEGRQAINEFRDKRLHDTFALLEDQSFREARFRVFNDIEPKQSAGEQWWNDDDLHKVASKVAGCYDQIGLRMKLNKLSSPDREILIWLGESVVRSHGILEGFLAWRRKTAPKSYAGYTDLCELAEVALQSLGNEGRRMG